LTFLASAASGFKSVNLNDLLQPEVGHFLATEVDPLKDWRIASSENEWPQIFLELQELANL
jgi:hypothetical protein